MRRQLRFALNEEQKRYAMIVLQRRRTYAGGTTTADFATNCSGSTLGKVDTVTHRHTASKTRYTREKVVSPFALSNPPAM